MFAVFTLDVITLSCTVLAKSVYPIWPMFAVATAPPTNPTIPTFAVTMPMDKSATLLST